MLVLKEFAVRAAVAGVLAIALLAGCAGSPKAAPADRVRVTLLLFSGRPNPTFELEPRLAAERLGARLAETRAIEAAAGESVAPGTLGYNGILVENAANAPGLPRSMLVYRDRVQVRDGKASVRADEGRQLEQLLIQLALERGAITERELEWIQAERPPR